VKLPSPLEAVAQLVEHLLCKKNTRSAVLEGSPAVIVEAKLVQLGALKEALSLLDHTLGLVDPSEVPGIGNRDNTHMRVPTGKGLPRLGSAACHKGIALTVEEQSRHR
jgi:hypothetical protein